MPAEGAGRCCELSVRTESWRDGEGGSGVPPSPLGLGVSGGTALLNRSWALAGGCCARGESSGGFGGGGKGGANAPPF